MDKEEILISIVMPTLNSELTIERALKSIRNQTIDKDKIEILVIDGGSIDGTKELAVKYSAKIFFNERVVPEAAKQIGINASKGKYIVFMDSDEEFSHDNQLRNRLELFKKYPQVKSILTRSLYTPDGYAALSRYVNSFGDPFSYFVYRMDNEDLIYSLNRKKYKCEEDNINIIYYFEEDDIVPIGDGGTVMFDLDYMRKEFTEQIHTSEFTASLFYQVIKQTKCVGIIKDDAIFHYSSANIKVHLKKLKFRVENNLAPKENYAGFASRASVNGKLQYRKYMFIIYCALIPWVLADSISLVIKKKNFIFLTHFLFTYYVFFQLIYQSVLLVFGKNKVVKKYGE